MLLLLFLLVNKTKDTTMVNDTTQFELDMASLNINVATTKDANEAVPVKYTPKQGKINVLEELKKRSRSNINLIVIGSYEYIMIKVLC
jgi:hypothetical protein